MGDLVPENRGEILKMQMVTLICYGISFIVYSAILLWGILGEHRGSFWGYGLVSFYFAIPATSFIMALILNLKNALLKWLYPFIFAVFGLIIARTVMTKWLSDVWLLCVLPAFVGSGIGLLIHFAKHK